MIKTYMNSMILLIIIEGTSFAYNYSGKISIDEFFTICDIIENVSKYQLDKIKPLQCWVNFRAKMN